MRNAPAWNNEGGNIMAKSVLVDVELWNKILRFMYGGDDRIGTPPPMGPAADDIRRGLDAKLEAQAKHYAYHAYKTAPTPEEREIARQEWLDRQGVPQSYRTPTEQRGL